MRRSLPGWLRPAGAAATLAFVVWRLGTGPFLDGVRAVDGRGARGRHGDRRGDDGVLRVALDGGGARPRRRHRAARRRGRLLPLALPEPHAPRRGGG